MPPRGESRRHVSPPEWCLVAKVNADASAVDVRASPASKISAGAALGGTWRSTAAAAAAAATAAFVSALSAADCDSVALSSF